MKKTSLPLVSGDLDLRHPAPPPPPAGHPRIRVRAFALGAALAVGLFAAPALAQTDNFDDEDDNGWVRMDPLAGVGVGGTGTWTVSDGAYRIQAAPAAPTPYGPGRAGSVLSGVNLSSFYVAVDVVGWNNSLDQIHGVLARLGQVGLGSTRGYALTYATRAGRNPAGEFEILRITGEDGTTLPGAGVNFTMQPGAAYRLVFTGNGSSFTGMVLNPLSSKTPLATVTGTDSTYSSGGVGLFTYDNSPSGTGAADVSFDNFLAAPAAPPRLSIRMEIEGEVILSWPTAAAGYVLQRALTLSPAVWTDITAGIEVSGGSYTYLHGAGEPASFFRLRWP